MFDDVQLLDVVGPADVFDAANRVTRSQAYDLHLVSPDGHPVTAGNGMRLAVDGATTSFTGDLDTLMVAGGWGSAEVADAPEVIAFVRRVARHARRVCSVCTGALLLAEAGVLEGRRATTHWAFGRTLAAFEGVEVEADRLFVRDGNIATSAGVASGIDLALSLVEEDLGAEVARTIARWLVVFLHRSGGQSQFSERLRLPPISSHPIRTAVDLIAADPAGDHRVDRLASNLGMSPRHFAREFRRHTGTTPAAYVEQVRVEAAKGLLESSSATLPTIARTVGFGSEEGMRQAFQRRLGIPPGEYRNRFTQPAGPSGPSAHRRSPRSLSTSA